jgi:hypothetical protein
VPYYRFSVERTYISKYEQRTQYVVDTESYIGIAFRPVKGGQTETVSSQKHTTDYWFTYLNPDDGPDYYL